jgi:hypothetical protein
MLRGLARKWTAVSFESALQFILCMSLFTNISPVGYRHLILRVEFAKKTS